MLNVVFWATSLVSMGMGKVSTLGLVKPGFKSPPEDMCSDVGNSEMSSSFVQGAYQTSRLQGRLVEVDPSLLNAPEPLVPVVPRVDQEPSPTHGVPGSTVGTEPKTPSDATTETSRHDQHRPVRQTSRFRHPARIVAWTFGTLLVVCLLAACVFAAVRSNRGAQQPEEAQQPEAQQPQPQSAWDRALEKGDLRD
mmetsp:Transcript_120741/g.336920  ORF Transcript_120741/g.336920 Transcript_120741/m.336920 type:complete len:194 (-) Transcript_120741:85-666(-)